MPKKNKYAGLTKQQRLEQMAREADEKDQKAYDRRHFIYNVSKGVVSFFKSIFSRKIPKEEERVTFRVSYNDLQDGTVKTAALRQVNDDAVRAVQEKFQKEIGKNNPQDMNPGDQKKFYDELKRQLEARQRIKNFEIRMVSNESITLGGTKPMRQYTDSNGQRWLAKQAVNCLGFAKLSGALLTEAGAKIQELVDPATAVQAFSGRTQEYGDVSFQRRLENVLKSKIEVEVPDPAHPGDPAYKIKQKVPNPDYIDLFRFSKHPEIATEETIKKVEKLGDQILREHTTDWLLCNFDTKGENFILTQEKPNAPLVLHGLDKEAAFNYLSNPQSQHMSRTYRPHNNDTLYNVMFTMYAQGKLNLDLNSITDRVSRITKMSDEAYMENYKGYLDHIKAKDPEHYAEKYVAILERKQTLAKEYRNFFGSLVNERIQNVDEVEARKLRDKYLDPQGRMKMFADAPETNPAMDKLRKMKLEGFLEMRITGLAQKGFEKLYLAQKAEQALKSEKDSGKRTRMENLISNTDYLRNQQKKFYNSKEAAEFIKSIKKVEMKDLTSPQRSAEIFYDVYTLKKASNEAERMQKMCKEMAADPQKYRISKNYQELLKAGTGAFALANHILQNRENSAADIGSMKEHPKTIFTILLCKAIEKERATNPAGQRGYWERAVDKFGLNQLVEAFKNNVSKQKQVKNFSFEKLKKYMLTPTDAKQLNAQKDSLAAVSNDASAVS